MQNKNHKQLVPLVHAGIAMLALTISMVCLAVLFYLHEQAEARAVLTTQNLAIAVSKSFESMISTIDLALQTSADEISATSKLGQPNPTTISEYLVRQSERLPNATIIRATDESGDVIYGAGILANPNNASDRDFFIRARDDPNAGLILSKPFVARIDNVWVWSFARRIKRPDGSFGGVVFARININTLEQILAQIEMGAQGLISLRDANLGLIARHPKSSLSQVSIGDSQLSRPFQAALKADPLAGTYVSGETSLDGVSRIHSYRKCAKYGFTVNIGVSQDEVLVDWYRQVWITLGLMTAFIVASLLFSRHIHSAGQREAADLEALQASRRDLLEAQQIALLGHYIYDLSADYWSSSEVLDGIFGIDDTFARDSQHWLALVHPDMRQEMQAYLEALILECRPFDQEYRIIRQNDGQERWVHGKGVFKLDEDGKPMVLMGTIQDIHEQKSAQVRLAKLLAEQKAVLENSLIGIVRVSDRIIRWANPAIERMFGYQASELVGASTRILYPSTEAFQSLGTAAYPRLLVGSTYCAQIEMQHKLGERIWVEIQGIMLNQMERESLWGFVDISERKQAEQALRENQRRFQEIFDSVSDAIFIHDAETGLILDVNRRMCEMYGYSREDVIGKSAEYFSQGTPPYSAADACELINRARKEGLQTFEWMARAQDGRLFWVEVSLRFAQIGQQQHILAVVRDVGQRKSIEEMIRKLAFYDPLTQLPNRRLMTDRMQQLLSRNMRSGEMAAVCMLDLDGFKAVNDRHGHEAGDLLLCEVAQRLQANIRQADTVARLGGDEFALLLGQFHNIADLEQLLTRIVTEIAGPISLKGATALISASIGVALFPEDSHDPDLLLNYADQALYKAKHAGKNRFLFYQSHQNKGRELHHQMLGKIGKALSKEQFELFYQPQIDCRLGKVVGVEALVRWRHPVLGLLQPGEFLPLIQHNDHIVSLDAWALKVVLRQMAEWREAGLNLTFSVNASSRQLHSKHFAEHLAEALGTYPADHASRLTFEIAESAALEDISVIIEAINSCHAQGLKVALDDFGTGFSSLTHLTQLSVDILKIDRSLISSMFDGPEHIALVESIIGLGNSFQRSVVAEGIERIDDAIMLLELGCQTMQGNFFAQPMPASEFLAWANAFTPDRCWHMASESDWHDYFALIKALVSHHRWVSRVLADRSASHLGEAPTALIADDQCPLGQWYKGAGQQRFDGDKDFVQLGEAHILLHRIAADLHTSRQSVNPLRSDALEADLLNQHQEIVRLLASLRNRLE